MLKDFHKSCESKVIMSAKIVLVTLIAVSGAQLILQNSRLNRERVIRINSESHDAAPQGGTDVKINQGPIRNAGIKSVNDGRLRTNLNSGQNHFPPRDDAFVVEGAAFRRQGENERFDVHSSQGRRVIDSAYPTDGASLNTGGLNQNYNNGENVRSQVVSNQRNTNNEQTAQIQSIDFNEQSYVRNSKQNLYVQQTNNQESSNPNDRINNDQPNLRQGEQYSTDNKNSSHNTEINQRSTHQNVRTNVDQTNSMQKNENTQYEVNSDQNDQNLYQNSNQDNVQDNRTTNYQANSRSNQDQNDALNDNQNKFRNTQEKTFRNRNDNYQPTNRNSRASETNLRPTDSYFDTNTRTIIDKLAGNSQNYDKEAMEKEINNQIANMYFEKSTEPKPKTTQDNELTSKSGSGREDDKWVWAEAVEGDKNNATTGDVPEVDDRASFVGDQCATGYLKFNGVCVKKEKN